MKDMSVEELEEGIKAVIKSDDVGVLSKLGITNCWNELLRRFEELERQLDSWRGSRDGVLQSIDEMEYKNINLACCGNCKKHHEDSNAVRMDRCNSRRWGYYCDHYQTDGLSRAEREGK